MEFHIITLFPKVFETYKKTSIIGRAVDKGIIKIHIYNPIDFVEKGRVDDKTYGGGPGMVIKAEPVLKAYKKAVGRKKEVESIFFQTNGEKFDKKMVKKLLKFRHVVLICGHYEGIDERVAEITKAKKVSVGDFVLSGGEIPALLVLDSVSRHIKGVLGNSESIEEKRTASPTVFTRPEEVSWGKRKYRIPKVLLTGHHKNIEKWRKEKK